MEDGKAALEVAPSRASSSAGSPRAGRNHARRAQSKRRMWWGNRSAVRIIRVRADKKLENREIDAAESILEDAHAFFDQGDYAAAKPLFEQALSIREKTLGAEHPLTAASLNSLAFLRSILGDDTAAKPLHERALAIREKAMGAEHPDTGVTVANLAGLLNAQGEHAAAQPLFERAVVIFEHARGAAHPYTKAYKTH